MLVIRPLSLPLPFSHFDHTTYPPEDLDMFGTIPLAGIHRFVMLLTSDKLVSGQDQNHLP